MNTDRLFKQLEPPPGGADRFAQRLEAETARAPVAGARLRTFAFAAAAAAAVLLVVVLVLQRAPGDATPTIAADPPLEIEIYESPAFDRLLGRPLKPEQLTAIVNRQTAAVTELESQNPNVRIYQTN
jgi:hypothetical protein